MREGMTPSQRARTHELLRRAGEEGEELAELVAMELDSDPVAREIAALRADLRTELRSATEGLREEQRGILRLALLIVALGMLVSAGIAGGVAGLSQSVSWGAISVSTEAAVGLEDDDGGSLLDTSPLEIPSPELEPALEPL